MKKNILKIPVFHTAIELELKNQFYKETKIDLTEDKYFSKGENNGLLENNKTYKRVTNS